MNDDTLNMEVRKFLKQVGVSSQREIEHAILKAVEDGRLQGSETLDIKMTLELSKLNLKHCIEGKVALE